MAPRTVRTDREEALRRIVDTHHDMLMQHCVRLADGDRQFAEDVVQETYIRAWQNADRLVCELGSVRGWLKQVAHNIAVDRYRAARRRPLVAAGEWANEPHCADGTSDVLDRMVLDEALRTLPPEHRAALTETFLRDSTAQQAARRLGVPTGTVKSRVFYGLRRLRDTMNSTLATS